MRCTGSAPRPSRRYRRYLAEGHHVGRAVRLEAPGEHEQVQEGDGGYAAHPRVTRRSAGIRSVVYPRIHKTTGPWAVQRQQAWPGRPFAAHETIETFDWLCVYQVAYGATPMHDFNSTRKDHSSFSAISVLTVPASAAARLGCTSPGRVDAVVLIRPVRLLPAWHEDVSERADVLARGVEDDIDDGFGPDLDIQIGGLRSEVGFQPLTRRKSSAR